MSTLRYINDDEAGYSRKKWGRGFTYRDQNGETISDSGLRTWIEALAIPPAWTDVWISPYKNGHILATGRDDKGRKQYCYHPLWQEMQKQKKFNRLYDFGLALPQLREVTDGHLRQHKLSRERVLAAIVRLLEQTLIRIGNREYAQRNDTFGLTTLQDDHVEITTSRVTFDFTGKSGQEHTIILRDRRLARIVQRCQDIPGYELFQYYDESGKRQVVDSSDVNDYLQTITREAFTAKVFRTWGGSILAVKYLAENGATSEPETVSRDCVTYVASELGNTTTVCKQYYIHPLILEAHQGGKLSGIYNAQVDTSDEPYALSSEEKTLMDLMDAYGSA